jgi:hypothetical protein
MKLEGKLEQQDGRNAESGRGREGECRPESAATTRMEWSMAASARILAPCPPPSAMAATCTQNVRVCVCARGECVLVYAHVSTVLSTRWRTGVLTFVSRIQACTCTHIHTHIHTRAGVHCLHPVARMHRRPCIRITHTSMQPQLQLHTHTYTHKGWCRLFASRCPHACTRAIDVQKTLQPVW